MLILGGGGGSLGSSSTAMRPEGGGSRSSGRSSMNASSESESGDGGHISKIGDDTADGTTDATGVGRGDVGGVSESWKCAFACLRLFRRARERHMESLRVPTNSATSIQLNAGTTSSAAFSRTSSSGVQLVNALLVLGLDEELALCTTRGTCAPLVATIFDATANERGSCYLARSCKRQPRGGGAL